MTATLPVLPDLGLLAPNARVLRAGTQLFQTSGEYPTIQGVQRVLRHNEAPLAYETVRKHLPALQLTLWKNYQLHQLLGDELPDAVLEAWRTLLAFSRDQVAVEWADERAALVKQRDDALAHQVDDQQQRAALSATVQEQQAQIEHQATHLADLGGRHDALTHEHDQLGQSYHQLQQTLHERELALEKSEAAQRLAKDRQAQTAESLRAEKNALAALQQTCNQLTQKLDKAQERSAIVTEERTEWRHEARAAQSALRSLQDRHQSLERDLADTSSTLDAVRQEAAHLRETLSTAHAREATLTDQLTHLSDVAARNRALERSNAVLSMQVAQENDAKE